MKRFLSVVLLLAVCVTTAVFAQTTDTPLSPNQWKRAIAIVGQNAALEGRYGHPENEFPEDYTIDDLNKVYKNEKWKAVYKSLKAKETQVGNMQQLKDIAKEYDAPIGGIERDVLKYIAEHPETEKSTAVADKPSEVPQQETGDTVATDSVSTVDEVEVINATAGNATAEGGRGVSMFIDILLFLLSAVALFVAWLARRENAELKKELDYKTKNIASQFEKFSKNITTDLNRVTYKVNKRRTADGGDSTISFNDDDASAKSASEAETPVVEPKKYYLAKPDGNGYFVKVSDKMEIGNSIYELSTFDGQTGTFHVIDDADVHHFALMMPTENLLRACTGNAIQMSNGHSRIATDRDGTARYENGKWHVAVKAIIHYEA